MSGKTQPALKAPGDRWLTLGLPRTGDAVVENPGYLPFKRSFDLLISTVVMAGILIWLLPLLALLIRLDSKGPAFFIQKRIGKNGRSFSCFKLRTMFTAEQRITRLGRWLRSTHLDELPQFWNVMAGSMSIVGPRPYMPTDCRQFAELVHDMELRHVVRPGITGMAQSRGLHGNTTKDKYTIAERCRWDLYYIRHAGFRLDMRILGETIVLLLRGQRARGLSRVR